MKRSAATLAVLSLMVATLAVGGCKEGDDDPPGLAAKFDYSVPSRFKVPDPRSPEGQYEIYIDPGDDLHPTTWLVRLNACKSTGSIVKYSWSIDGTPVGDVASCDAFEYPFAAEGTYSVELVVEEGDGVQESLTADVVVRDLLIFGISANSA